MAGQRAAQVIDEQDDDSADVAAGNSGASPIERELESGGTIVNLRQPQQNEPNVDDDFDIIDETIPNQRPEREASLEQDNQQRSFVDQQRADADGRRRETRSERRARQNAARQATENENAILRQQLIALENRMAQIEPLRSEFAQNRAATALADLDRQIEDHERAVSAAEQRLANALTALAQGDENARDDMTRALRQRDDAYTAKLQATTNRNLAASGIAIPGMSIPVQQQPQQQFRQQPVPQPLSPRAQAKVQEFLAEIPWFNPRGTDFDSKIMRQIDDQVISEGFVPESDDYYDELERRGAQYLPHRFKSAPVTPQPQTQQRQSTQRQAPAQPQRRGPMTSGGAEQGGGGRGRMEVRLTPERKTALVQAGALDQDGRTVADRAKYLRILKGYAEFDRSNSAAR